MLTNLTPFQALLLSLYVPMSLVLAIYGLHRVHMVFGYLRARGRTPRPEGQLKELPSVLVQVPVFNERAVVRAPRPAR